MTDEEKIKKIQSIIHRLELDTAWTNTFSGVSDMEGALKQIRDIICAHPESSRVKMTNYVSCLDCGKKWY